MRTLFVGDVHGCADELGWLLREVLPTRVVLVGDLFTKGPDPAGVWALIQRWGAEAVLGNHDVDVLQRWRPGRDLPRAAFAWLSSLPWRVRGRGWLTVHAGIHPTRPEQTRRRHALHLRRWPEERPRNPHWWQLYRGPDLVIHGHDAAAALAGRRPHTIGLDTGCVRGGALTGYLLEQDRVVSVPATRR